MKLFEINSKNIPGPGDYHPGDEYNPRSPDYDPAAGRGRSRQRNTPQSHEELVHQHDLDRRDEDRRTMAKQAAHEAKITDVTEVPDYVHGKQYAPIITRTGIATDKSAAQAEIARLSYVAYRTYDNKVEEMPDGRVKFMLKYMM